jgi:hypothetical protein
MEDIGVDLMTQVVVDAWAYLINSDDVSVKQPLNKIDLKKYLNDQVLIMCGTNGNFKKYPFIYDDSWGPEKDISDIKKITHKIKQIIIPEISPENYGVVIDEVVAKGLVSIYFHNFENIKGKSYKNFRRIKISNDKVLITYNKFIIGCYLHSPSTFISINNFTTHDMVEFENFFKKKNDELTNSYFIGCKNTYENLVNVETD